MKSEPFFGMKYLQTATRALAVLFNVAILIAAAIEIVRVYMGIIDLNISSAIQDGLFVMILLEMFYVVRSFVKYGSVNTALIISVGILAIVEGVIFKLNDLTLETAAAYSMLFLTFSIGIVLENKAFERQVEQGNKPRSIRGGLDFSEDEISLIEEYREKTATL